MDDFLSRSAELLTTHPHLLDGGLGRGLLYSALALIFGTRVWFVLVARPVVPLRQISLIAGALGVVGLALMLNTLALQVAYPFGAENMPFFADGASYRKVLHGSFGIAWAAIAVFFILALLTLRSWFSWVFGIAMGLCLAANSHASEAGMLAWVYLIDALHLVLGLSWLGGVLVLAWVRLGGNQGLDVNALRDWSSVALPLFGAILALGVVRLLLTLRIEGEVNLLYGTMLGLKVAAVLAVIYHAQKLRRELRRSRFAWRKFDDGLSLELFAAFILILLTALITQLQPS